MNEDKSWPKLIYDVDAHRHFSKTANLEQYGGYRIILGRENSLSILLNRKLGQLSNFVRLVVSSMLIASSRHTADC